MAARGLPPRDDVPAVAELAAGGIVEDPRTGEILALHVASEDRWGFPKGHVEPGESTRQAARREIEEETGLTDLEVGERIAEVHYAFYTAGRQATIYKTVVYYLVRSGARDVRTEPIFDRYVWASPEQVRPMLRFDTDREVLQRHLDRKALARDPTPR